MPKKRKLQSNGIHLHNRLHLIAIEDFNYLPIFLFFQLFKENSVFNGHTEFYIFFKLVSLNIYSQKLIPLDN